MNSHFSVDSDYGHGVLDTELPKALVLEGFDEKQQEGRAQIRAPTMDAEKMMSIEAELAKLDGSIQQPESIHHSSPSLKRVSLVVPPLPPAKEEKDLSLIKSRAAAPNSLQLNLIEERRPMTSSSKRLSFTSMSTSRRPIKYGKGKHARTELVPQPSDDLDDPLVCAQSLNTIDW